MQVALKSMFLVVLAPLLLTSSIGSVTAITPSFRTSGLELVSLDDAGQEPFFLERFHSAISPNGRYVAFTTGGAGGTSTLQKVAVRDLLTGVTVVHPAATTAPITANAVHGVTNDGTAVVSTSNDLVEDDQSRGESTTNLDVYRIALDGTPTLVSGDVNGSWPGASGGSVALSADASVVAFVGSGPLNNGPGLWTGTGDGLFEIEVDQASPCIVISAQNNCTRLALSDDGNWLAIENAADAQEQWVIWHPALDELAYVPGAAEESDEVLPLKVGLVAEEDGPSAVQLNWSGSTFAWAPFPGTLGIEVYNRSTFDRVHIDVDDATVRVIDLSADGQFVLASVVPTNSAPETWMIDVDSGDRFVVSGDNLAQGVALDAFGDSLLWGDQDPRNSRLFVERFDYPCNFVAGSHSPDHSLRLCANGRARGYFGSVPVGAASWEHGATAIDVVENNNASGFWVAYGDGKVTAHGSSSPLADASGAALASPMVAMIGLPETGSYWMVAGDGGVFTWGINGFFGSAGGIDLNEPIVTAMATPSLEGYWLIAGDGGVFSFGDARFFGSTGALQLVSPIVAAAASPTGAGYWLAGADGGVFSFGDADFLGSAAGSLASGEEIADFGSDEGGYWMMTTFGRFIDFPRS